MASAAFPLPADLSFSDDEQDSDDRLDDDIARVRVEIQSLTKRKNQLVSSLLSSTRVQSYFNLKDTNPGTTNTGTIVPDQPLDVQTPLQAHNQHNTTNVHRLAYGVTSFPFSDPNPDTVSDKPLLGIRFDIPDNLTGKFSTAPYYIFLKRVKGHDRNNEIDASNANGTATATTEPTEDNGERLQIHHHTIPALVPLQDYETKYLLPSSHHEQIDSGAGSQHHTHAGDEGYYSPSSERNGNDDEENNEHGTGPAEVQPSPSWLPGQERQSSQDLHGLVSAVRRDLASWRLRSDAIRYLSKQLKLLQSQDHAIASQDRPEETAIEDRRNQVAGLRSSTLRSVEATGVDARYCRLVWKNGTVARLRITDHGHVDRAVVIGDTGEGRKPDRLRDLERILCTGKDGGVLGIADLPGRLQLVEAKMKKAILEQSLEINEDSEHSDSMVVDG